MIILPHFYLGVGVGEGDGRVNIQLIAEALFNIRAP